MSTIAYDRIRFIPLQKPYVWAMDIIVEVARAHGVTRADLTGLSRKGHITRARQEAYYLIRTLTSHSYPRIGSFFNRDHTTVLHGVRKHIERMRAA